MDEAQRLIALEQELRRDLDAIERVKKMMAFKNGSLGALPEERTIKHIEIGVNDGLNMGDSLSLNLADVPATSLRGSIEAIINKDPSVRWTVQKMVAHLKDSGFELKATKPIYSVGQAMKILASRGKIRLTRRGSGSEPNVYRGKDQAKEDGSATV